MVADQKRQTRRTRTKIDPGLVLTVLLALFAAWPLLSPGLPNTADGPIHFYRAVDMQQAWRDGVLYPRWSANLALGYGTPLFNFAPPLISILMMLWNTASLDLALAMKLVVILFIFVSALGAYLLGREYAGNSEKMEAGRYSGRRLRIWQLLRCRSPLCTTGLRLGYCFRKYRKHTAQPQYYLHRRRSQAFAATGKCR